MFDRTDLALNFLITALLTLLGAYLLGENVKYFAVGGFLVFYLSGFIKKIFKL